MVRFRGTVQGNRGEASRLGHTSGGLQVRASTWHEHVIVGLYVDADDRDCVSIIVQGKSTRWGLYNGPIAKLADMGVDGYVQFVAQIAIKQEFEP